MQIPLRKADLIVGSLVMSIFFGLIIHGIYTIMYLQGISTLIDFS